MLHNHSDHSVLDGRARTSELAEQAVANGMEALAITDHDSVGGHIEFFNSCTKVGIKPILGTEARWVHSVEASREAKTSGRDSSHICLLAADQTGLRNLWSLSSLACEPERFYGKPQLEISLMRQYSEGLWASDSCGLTRFADAIEKGDEDIARTEWSILLDIFGDRFYSELHTFRIIDPVTDEDHALNAKITAMNQAKMRFSRDMGVPLVVVNDAHYAQKHQWEEHRMVYNLSTQAYRKDQVESKGQAADWLMSPEEMVFHMGQHGIPRSVTDEAIKNNSWIAEQCNVEIKPTLSMPRLYPTDAEDAAAFRRGIEEGFRRFIVEKGLDEDVYRQRLEYEAALIVDAGMPGYFNVTADYVMAARDGSWARWVDPNSGNDPCLCGPGRGSGGGSLVNYVLGITSLDPIKYDLMFERFINPDRVEPPDIDVDFQKSKRQGVKDYLGARYGHENVCSIGTRSKSGPKQMLKDLCRAEKVPFSDTTKMAALIGEVDTLDDAEDNLDDEAPPTWDEVLQELGGDLAEWAAKYPRVFRFLEQMIGLNRQAGVHAAGVVVNTEPLLGNIPTRVKNGVRATQFDMNECFLLGGVKDDLLANKGLDVLAIARKLVYDHHGVWLDYDGFGFGVPADAREVITFGDDQYNDPAIWTQIDRGLTAGIFQISTPGGTKAAMRFKPRSLSDLADLVAINRPGVIRAGQLDHYLARRNGDEDVIYDHPMMALITARTMGILVYQEDMMRTAVSLAGFTPGGSEGLRKAIGKKMADKIAELKPVFLDGCMANPEFTSQGGTLKTATKIWASLEAAGAYSFNMAHSVGYAMQALWEIWTKHYYFDEFVVACLEVYPDKTNAFLRECRKRGRPILVPDINLSGSRFTLTSDGVRFGMTDVRGLGEKVMPDILANRPYTSVADFLTRTSKAGGRKKGVVDALIKVGAFDSVEPSRELALETAYYFRAAEEVAEGKWGKLDVDERNAIVARKWAEKPEDYPRYDFDDEKVIFDLETELLGTHVTVDPMAKYAGMIEGVCIQHPMDMDDFDTGQRFVVGGELTKIKHHVQRNGRKMAFLTVRWNEEDFDITAFAESYEANLAMLQDVNVPVACEVIKLSKGCQLSLALRLDWK